MRGEKRMTEIKCPHCKSEINQKWMAFVDHMNNTACFLAECNKGHYFKIFHIIAGEVTVDSTGFAISNEYETAIKKHKKK